MKKITLGRKELLENLALVQLFSGLDESQLASFAKGVEARELKSGELVFSKGERANGFFAVISGQVRIFRLGADGREQVLHFMGPGEVCGEVPVFQGGRYPASCCCAKSGTLLYVDGGVFLEVCEKHADILLEMLAVLSKRLRTFVELVEDLSLREVPARVAKYLLDLTVRQKNDTITLPVTKAALAGQLGTTPESLSRALATMKKKNLIEVTGRKISILDREGLCAASAGVQLKEI